jgi:hypothetical protein
MIVGASERSEHVWLHSELPPREYRPENTVPLGNTREYPNNEHYSKPHVIEKKNNPRAASYASR